jgi:soluble epoxide hydrolase/lipid-phosphate phosphatase
VNEIHPPFRSGTIRRGDHVTSYLESGPRHGQPIVLVHGWPETSWAWRHQLEALGALGYRVIAPDLRGTGGSTVYRTHDAYALRHHVEDLIGLADGLDLERPVWVGQDWGAPIIWSIARAHPERFRAGASINTPYDTLERGFDRMVSFVNRTVYPEDEFPAGQVDYYLFYQDHFADAQADFEADIPAFFTAVLRAGEPGKQNEPFLTAFVRRNGGWFGGGPAPQLPLDTQVIDQTDLDHFTAAYTKTGFFGVNSLYLNDEDNRDFVRSTHVSRLTVPTLFVGGRWDYVNDTENSSLAIPMRTLCTDLDYRVVEAGHWTHHERHAEVSALLDDWLRTKVIRNREATPGA